MRSLVIVVVLVVAPPVLAQAVGAANSRPGEEWTPYMAGPLPAAPVMPAPPAPASQPPPVVRAPPEAVSHAFDSAAEARPRAATAIEEARLHHAPPPSVPANEPMVLRAEVERPDLAPHVVVVYEGSGGAGEVPFERSASGFAATIPADAVKAPGLAYAIEAEPTPGHRTALFATRAVMQPVRVTDDLDDEREQVSLARLEGRRSLLQASTEYAMFGTEVSPANGAVRDEYWRVDGAYTYRTLRRVVEFGIRFGVVRGSALVENATSPKDFKVGLNYGAPRLRVRLVDWVHLDLETLTSVTEVGFSVGGGGALILGDPLGNRLTFGFEGIQVFGARGWVRLDLAAGTRVALGPSIEVTTMPHAPTAGIRLALDTKVALGRGVALTARAGYQARAFNQGGVALGTGVEWAF